MSAEWDGLVRGEPVATAAVLTRWLLLVTSHRIAIHIYRILLSPPEILLGFIRLRLLSLLLQRRKAFPFLVSHASCLRRFAANKNRGATNNADESKLHIFQSYNESGPSCQPCTPRRARLTISALGVEC